MVRTARKPAEVTGYAIAAGYDEESDRLFIQFPEFTEEEHAFRKALAERTLAHRNQQPPLDITTAELIHAARAEASMGTQSQSLFRKRAYVRNSGA